MAIERERVYVIPPGVYLSVDEKGALRLSKPQARHGARLPFDFLLNSLAREHGARTVCVVLSGTGADGSLGLKAVKESGGLVIAQDIGEADYDGMPRSAIATGAVDLVLRAAKIAEALVARERGDGFAPERPKSSAQKSVEDLLPDIIDLLRTKTVHDFTLYKHGTLERRVERRMAMAAVKTAAKYLELLLRDANERDQLSRDLLINVTGFFRDAAVFDFLAKSVIPDLVRDHALDRPLRIWVAGCSSGEETYSLAMLFREQIDASKRDVKLQIFASDVDPDAVASAREGLYPESIEADVSPEAIGPIFHQGGSLLPGLARVALERRVHGAGRARGPAIRASRLRFVPEPSDLPSARGAGQGRLHLPFRVARRRPSAGRQCRDGRRGRRPVRRHFQTAAPLSTRRRHSTGRFRSVVERRRRLPDARASGPGPRLRARSSLPSFVDGWCWRPTVRLRC